MYVVQEQQDGSLSREVFKEAQECLKEAPWYAAGLNSGCDYL